MKDYKEMKEIEVPRATAKRLELQEIVDMDMMQNTYWNSSAIR